MCKYLQQDQTIYLAGGHDDTITETCWYAKQNTKPQPDPKYTSNAEETDTRLWVHVKQTEYRKILVISPDTDVYHIGLPLVSNKEVVVQVSPINSKEMKFVNLQALSSALCSDPDLAGLNATELCQILQTLFVCTGCDYISFFSGLGKATFLRYFFQYATFITGANAQGSLTNIQLQGDIYKQGFLAFLRLVGTTYYKKHASGFDTPSPASHFLRFSDAANPLAHHHQWIDDVRQNIADRCTFDNKMIPSTDALYYHWKRSCWVLNMWAQSDRNTMVLEPITDYGWHLDNDTLHLTWDTEENVRERVSTLLKGCKCMTGCKNRICGCRKNGRNCSEGCQCTNCENHALPSQDRQDLADVALEETVHNSMELEEEEEFAEFVFAAAFDVDDVNTEFLDE